MRVGKRFCLSAAAASSPQCLGRRRFRVSPGSGVGSVVPVPPAAGAAGGILWAGAAAAQRGEELALGLASAAAVKGAPQPGPGVELCCWE